MVADTIPKTRQNTKTTTLVAIFTVLQMENRWARARSGVPRMTVIIQCPSRDRGNGPAAGLRYGWEERGSCREHRFGHGENLKQAQASIPSVSPVPFDYPVEGFLSPDVQALNFLLCRNSFSLPARSLETYAPSPRE